MSIDLLLRSARKYLLSTGSNQLMSNEKNVAWACRSQGVSNAGVV